MSLLSVLHDPVWQPLTLTLLHFFWQGMIVAALWLILFRLTRALSSQFRCLLGLAGMFVMAACPVATFIYLESETTHNQAAPVVVSMHATTVTKISTSPSKAVFVPTADANAIGDNATPSLLDPTQWIGNIQPYLLAGWISGLVLLSGRLLLGVVGVHRLGRGRLAISGELAARASTIALRLGLRTVPRVFSSVAAGEAIVVGLLRPMVLLPVAWLTEMTPEVLEAVIAHELSHIRRFDLWFNLFQRFVETILFYHPAVWWLSRRVRLAREMCCDELAIKATGDCVVYATALEFAAGKRLKPSKSLLEVALGVTRMTLLDRVRNVLGLAARHEQGRWWPAAVLTLLVPPAVWLASMSGVTSAQEDKPMAEKKTTAADPSPTSTGSSWLEGIVGRQSGKCKATASFQIRMEENPVAGVDAVPMNRDRFDIYKNTQMQRLQSLHVIRAALRKPKVAKLSSVQRQQAAGNIEDWLRSQLHVDFPGKAEVMSVTLYGDDPKETATLLNAIVDTYLSEVVNTEQDRKRRRLSELETICSDKDQEMREKRRELKTLAAEMGASDTESLSVRQKLVLDELATYQQEMATIRGELRRSQTEMAVQKAFLRNLPKDATAKESQAIIKEITRLQVTLDIVGSQYKDIEKKSAQARKEAERFGTGSVDMEMLRGELKRLDSVMATITSEREKVRVEIRAVPRVTLLEYAELPTTPDSKPKAPKAR